MTASTTRRTTARARIAAVGAIAVAGTLLLTACGDQTDSASQESGSGKETKSGAPLFSKLPEKYQKSGVIKVGTNAEYAPMESVENGKIVGVDPDLAAALGKQLGVKFEFTSGSFDGLITALNSGRHDIAMSSITDNKQRQEGLDDSGKKLGEGVDFVDYFLAGTAVYTKKGNPQNIKSIKDLDGKIVGVQQGTTGEAYATENAPGAELLQLPSDGELWPAIQAGTIDAILQDQPVNVEHEKADPNYKIVEEYDTGESYGFAFAKGEKTALLDAVNTALQELRDSGDYDTIYDSYFSAN